MEGHQKKIQCPERYKNATGKEKWNGKDNEVSWGDRGIWRNIIIKDKWKDQHDISIAVLQMGKLTKKQRTVLHWFFISIKKKYFPLDCLKLLIAIVLITSFLKNVLSIFCLLTIIKTHHIFICIIIIPRSINTINI